MKIKVKIWIEDNEKNLIYGDGKNEILSHLDITNNLKKTSEIMNLDEEKIFQHLEIIEKYSKDEMVLCVKGLKKDSIAKYELTSQAREILQTYAIFNYEINNFAKRRFAEIFK